MLNLFDWSQLTGIIPTHPTTEKEAVSVTIDVTRKERAELWNLTDYFVTSASGAVVWLRPRTIQMFEDITPGTIFRWIGGVTPFCKISDGTAIVDGEPNKYCHPNRYDELIAVGWSPIYKS